MAFRILDQNPVYLDASGVPCAGGSLTFTRTGTSTAHNVFTDSGLGTSLGNVITLDSAARTSNAGVPVDVWLDASTYAYRVVLKNSAGSTIWTKDNVREIDTAGVTVPDPGDGDDGDVLLTDGVAYYFDAIRQVPDPTGHSGKVLGTDGSLLNWQALESESYDEDNLPGSLTQDNEAEGGFTIGNIRVQWGADTAPSAAAISTTKAVTFGVAFSGTPYYVGVTPTVAGVTSDSPAAACSAQALSQSQTGFTASFFAGAENNGGNTNITSSVTFKWFAVGPK
jgi:hypothetical protein